MRDLNWLITAGLASASLRLLSLQQVPTGGWVALVSDMRRDFLGHTKPTPAEAVESAIKESGRSVAVIENIRVRERVRPLTGR